MESLYGGAHYKEWKAQDLHDLKDATSFEDLVPIAIRILERLEQPIIEVCGPISTGGSGSLSANLERFTLAVEILMDNEINVFSQVPFESQIHLFREQWKADGGEGYCMPILEVFYRGVFESGLLTELWFLPDWRSSVGATWEMREAIRLKIPTRDYPVEWLTEYGI